MKNGNEGISYNGISYATRAPLTCAHNAAAHADSSFFNKEIGKESAENHGGLSAKEVLEKIPIDLAMQDKEFILAWADWVEYRLECGRLYRWVTTIRCFSRLMKFCQQIGPKRAADAIDRSIMLGYRGIFENDHAAKKTAEERKRAKWGSL